MAINFDAMKGAITTVRTSLLELRPWGIVPRRSATRHTKALNALTKIEDDLKVLQLEHDTLVLKIARYRKAMLVTKDVANTAVADHLRVLAEAYSPADDAWLSLVVAAAHLTRCQNIIDESVNLGQFDRQAVIDLAVSFVDLNLMAEHQEEQEHVHVVR